VQLLVNIGILQAMNRHYNTAAYDTGNGASLVQLSLYGRLRADNYNVGRLGWCYGVE